VLKNKQGILTETPMARACVANSEIVPNTDCLDLTAFHTLRDPEVFVGDAALAQVFSTPNGREFFLERGI
jgi:hypothetical protein